jgi:ABC-type branched-subunit amino acid transport system ATPase component
LKPEDVDTKLRQCKTSTHRKLAVATTILGDPTVLLLDEPTYGKTSRFSLSKHLTGLIPIDRYIYVLNLWHMVLNTLNLLSS